MRNAWINRGTMPGYLYRTYAQDGALLYIGSTTNLQRRIQQHNRNTVWRGAVARWKVRMYLDWRTADAAEAVAIRTEHPRWNIAGRSAGHPDGRLKSWLQVADLYPKDVSPPLAPLHRWRFDTDTARWAGMEPPPHFSEWDDIEEPPQDVAPEVLEAVFGRARLTRRRP